MFLSTRAAVNLPRGRHRNRFLCTNLWQIGSCWDDLVTNSATTALSFEVETVKRLHIHGMLRPTAMRRPVPMLHQIRFINNLKPLLILLRRFFNHCQMLVRHPPLLNHRKHKEQPPPRDHYNRNQVPTELQIRSFERVQFPSVFDLASKYLSLIMPAYNEQDQIRSTLDNSTLENRHNETTRASSREWHGFLEEPQHS